MKEIKNKNLKEIIENKKVLDKGDKAMLVSWAEGEIKEYIKFIEQLT